MNILVVFPFCQKDQELALSLLQWIGELGGCKDNDCLIVESGDTAGSIWQARVAEQARTEFREATTIKPPFALKDESHPIGPNWMFETALKHLIRTADQRPFLWLEPDCVPMRRGWLKEIEEEYASGNRPFLSHISRLGTPGFPDLIPSGVSVYPPRAFDFYKKLQTNRKQAWDIQFANTVVPMATRSIRIYSRLNHDLPPEFKESKQKGDAANILTVGSISKSVALFHPCKDGSLTNLLRNKIKPHSAAIAEPDKVDHVPNSSYVFNPHLTTDDGSEFMGSIPIIKAAIPIRESVRQNRIFHCVQRWKPSLQDFDRRILSALNSWVTLYETGEMIPCHLWEPFSRSSKDIYDARNLPYLKDVIWSGLSKSVRPNDIILLTNDDSILHPDLGLILFDRLEKQPCLTAGRMNIERKSLPDFSHRKFPTESTDIGRDLFAFRKDWLDSNFELIPDVFVGEAEFDLALAALIAKANGVMPTLESRTRCNEIYELPFGWVMHEFHTRSWEKAGKASALRKWTLSKCAQWYRDNGMGHMISYEVPK